MGYLDNSGLAHFWGKIEAALQHKLTGTAGQVVGFDANGTATAVRGWSNQDILDNSYFLNPINQRGQTEYTATGYTIDRWLANRATVSITSNGLMVTVNAGEANALICQRIEPDAFVIGEVYTISVLFGNTLRSLSFTLTGTDINVMSPETNDVRIQFIYTSNTGTYDVLLFVYGSENSVLFKSAKLEHSPVQTLAYKKGDTWVLNDPPPDYALELEKCQRYQILATVGFKMCGVVGSGKFPYLTSFTEISMRSTPTLKIIASGSVWVRTPSSGAIIIPHSEFIVFRKYINQITLKGPANDKLVPQTPIIGDVDSGSFLFDANL